MIYGDEVPRNWDVCQCCSSCEEAGDGFRCMVMRDEEAFAPEEWVMVATPLECPRWLKQVDADCWRLKRDTTVCHNCRHFDGPTPNVSSDYLACALETAGLEKEAQFCIQPPPDGCPFSLEHLLYQQKAAAANARKVEDEKHGLRVNERETSC